MVMAPIKDSVFSVMANLASVFLGGTVGNGRQFVSWIHEADFCRAVKFLIEHSEMSGAVNVCSPNPVRNREFNRALRAAVGLKVGLPLPAPILEIGALLMRTESELLLKSRCVVPERLLEAGFEFEFPVWDQAAEDLARKLFSRGAPILVA
jgi:NAD dependent epimerase/dehydratase family enzyme